MGICKVYRIYGSHIFEFRRQRKDVVVIAALDNQKDKSVTRKSVHDS